MRRFLSGLSILAICGAAGAADVSVDINPTLNALGLGSTPLSPVQADLPLGSLDDALPVIGVNNSNGLMIQGAGQGAFPQLPGLSSLPGSDPEVEIPGLDGLPIQATVAPGVDIPRIPGIDGLPLGFGRR